MILVKLVPVLPGICSFEVMQRAKFMQFSERGGIVYYVRYRVCMGTLGFAVMKFYISIDIFFEGGLLCAEN